MSEDDARQHLRLALSWRAEVLRLADAARDAAQRGALDLEEEALREAQYNAHREAAETALARARARITTQLHARGAALQHAYQRQQHLGEEVARGKLSPEQANETNRELLGEMEGLRRELQALNHLLRAETPEDAGGAIELPLDAYASQAALRAPALAPGWWQENRRTLIVALAGLILGVAGALFYLLQGNTVSFRVVPAQDPQARLVLECLNTTLRPVFWQVPWMPGADRGHGGYGVELHIRQENERDFQLYAPPAPVWVREGHYTEHMEPIRVMPALAQRVELDLAALRDATPGLEGLRIVCTRGHHAVFTVNLDPLP